jgi:beta-N-acetylhexosaminidase
VFSRLSKIHFINGQLQSENQRMLKKVLSGLSLLLFVFFAGAQTEHERWADSVIARLAPHEKIGQLFVLQVDAPATEADFNLLATQIKRFHPGGIEFKNVHGKDLKSLIARLRQLSPVPLLVGADENQVLHQADRGRSFPSHLQLAAIADDSLVHAVYDFAAGWMAHMGISYTTGLSLIPLSFEAAAWQSQLKRIGSDPELRSDRAQRWFSKLESRPCFAFAPWYTTDIILAATKTDTLRLPDISEFTSWQHFEPKIIRSTDFRYQIRNGNSLVPAARSAAFINQVVRGQLRFRGLISYAHQPGGDVSYQSVFRAGNDLITTPAIDEREIQKMRRAFRKSKQLQAQLNQSLRQVLALKFDLLAKTPGAETEPWQWRTAEKRVLLQRAFESSVTIVKNKDQALPIRNLDLTKMALVTLGDRPARALESRVEKYTRLKKITWGSLSDTVRVKNLIDSASHLVVAVVDPALSPAAATWLRKYTAEKTVVVCHMAGVAHLDVWEPFDALLAGYMPGDEIQHVLAQNLFGVQPGKGTLPAKRIPQEQATLEPLPRFSFSEPEAAGMDHETLRQIEPIVQEAISRGATPGAHVVIARHGKVVYQKSFGTLSYTTADPVTDTTLYDLASVTKVSATLQAIMFLQEKKIIDLNKKASAYLPELKGTNKEDMVLNDILTHQAGLWPFLPFWASTMKDSVWMPEFYQRTPSPDFPWPVAENLYARQAMKDSLWTWIIRSKVRDKQPRTPYDYRYSDMGFYILQRLAEKLLNQPLDEFLTQNLYLPLGASTLGYLPRTRHSKEQIAPTEEDKLFRKSLLVGFVHDQGAAMLGGVAGHAGLFGTGLDLAKLGQLWLNKGQYGDTRFFRPETVDLFTARQYTTSRRGLGWDKPILNDWNSPTATAASPFTFGHTGFTGTCIWVDPAYDLVFVFLSNRVHPDMTNGKLLNLNIRPRIQEVIYRSIFTFSLYRPPVKN